MDNGSAICRDEWYLSLYGTLNSFHNLSLMLISKASSTGNHCNCEHANLQAMPFYSKTILAKISAWMLTNCQWQTAIVCAQSSDRRGCSMQGFFNPIHLMHEQEDNLVWQDIQSDTLHTLFQEF